MSNLVKEKYHVVKLLSCKTAKEAYDYIKSQNDHTKIISMIRIFYLSKGPATLKEFSKLFSSVELKETTLNFVRSSDIRLIENYSLSLAKEDLKYMQRVCVNDKNSSLLNKMIKGVWKNHLSDLPSLIAQTEDMEFILKMAKNNPELKKDLLEDAIIRNNDANYIYRFAFYVKDANVDKLCHAVIDAGYPSCIVRFAQDINGADVKFLQAATLRINKPRWIYEFALKVAKADISKLERAIVKTRNVTWIKKFRDNVQGASKEYLQDALDEIESRRRKISEQEK